MPDKLKIITLSNGQTLGIPPDTPPEVEARLKAQSEEHIKNAPPVTVPTGGGEAQLPGSTNPDDSSAALPDPSEHDTWGDWFGKENVAALKGTGRGFARFGDMILNAGDVLINDAKSLVGADPSRDTTDTPATDWWEGATVPVPEGKGYQRTAENAEIYGPAVVETALTGGLATPTAVAGMPIRVARDTVVAPGAGALAAGIGEAIDKAAGGSGKYGRLAGEVASFAAPGATTKGTRSLVNKSFTDAKTLEKLAAFRRANARLPADKQIPVSLGAVGNRNAQNIEDLTARAPFSGQKIVDTRRKQVEGIENLTTDATNRIRGGPADQKISTETVGQKTDEMATRAHAAIQAKLEAEADALADKVGRDTPVTPEFMEQHLTDIISDPKKTADARRQASDLRDHLRENYPIKPGKDVTPEQQPLTGMTNQPTYNATKDARGEVGYTFDKSGRRIGKNVTGEAYKGMTEDMKAAAARQGVSEEEFMNSQEQQKALLRDREEVERVTGEKGQGKGRTGTQAHNTVFSGAGKNATTQLAPYKLHTPDELAEVLADKLELSLRGESNAGLPNPNADTFTLGGVQQGWKNRDEGYKSTYSGDNPSVRGALDDAAILEEAELSRTGRYSAPGKATNRGGGAVSRQGIPMFLGGLGLAGGGYSMYQKPLATTLALMGGAAGTELASRAMTSPRVIDYVANPKPVYTSPGGLADVLASGVAGTTAYEADQAQAIEEQRRQAEDEAQVRRWQEEEEEEARRRRGG